MHALAMALCFTAPSVGSGNPLPAILPIVSLESDSFEVEIQLDHHQSFTDIQPRLPVGFELPRLPSDAKQGLRREGDKQSQSNRIEAEWAALNSKLSFRDPEVVRSDPLRRDSTWAADETLRLPILNNLYLFGSVDAASDSVERQQLRWQGKTGLGMKVRPWLLDEVQLRGGQCVRYDDQDPEYRTHLPERTQLFLDVSTRLALPIVGRPVNVEYTSSSVPAITGIERTTLNQDLKLALPLSDGLSRVHLGARMTRDDTPTQTPWVDRTQLYLGLELKH